MDGAQDGKQSAEEKRVQGDASNLECKPLVILHASIGCVVIVASVVWSNHLWHAQSCVLVIHLKPMCDC